MSSNFALRPEDFQKAWANAYQLAVSQVEQMHRRADDQLEVANQLMQSTAEFCELTRTRLLGTAATVARRIGTATDRYESSVAEVNERLLRQVNALIKREDEVRAETQEMARKLWAERKAFVRMRDQLASRPLFKRLWAAWKNQS